MIDPKELRVGNIVEKDGIEYVADYLTIHMAYNYSPIELTREILQGVGFMLHRKYENRPITVDEFGKQRFADIEVLRFERRDFIISLEESVYSVMGHGVKIKYVHQLQNLYYALKGKELLD